MRNLFLNIGRGPRYAEWARCGPCLVGETRMLYGLSWIYAISILVMAVIGFNILFLVALAVWYRKPRPRVPELPAEAWPTVLVQLPLFNERYVVERLIDAAVALDYPADKL